MKRIAIGNESEIEVAYFIYVYNSETIPNQ